MNFESSHRISTFHQYISGYDQSFKNPFNGTTKSISDIGYAFYGGLWAFDGWNNLNYVTEELKNPIRDLPLAIMVGIPFVTCCYVMVNIAYLTVMTSAEIAQSSAVAVVSNHVLYSALKNSRKADENSETFCPADIISCPTIFLLHRGFCQT